MRKSYAVFLLEKTKNDYNLIAEDYARTRHFIWDIEGLNKYVGPGDKILDLGCGNGRLLEVLRDKEVDYTGLDISERLIEIARSRYPGRRFQVGNVLDLPFPENNFDKVFSIRVFAHIPSKEFRIRFLKEAKRVLKPGGLLILTVWYLYHLKNRKNFLLMIKNVLMRIIGKSELDFGDALIPWGNKAMRYYHFFTKSGLKKLAQESGFKIREISTTPFDIYLICQK